jgi:FkbM family methyltransferase
MQLHKIKLLRRVFLPIIQKLNIGDITLRHHLTKDKVKLHSFKHKGYWYHGRNRERDTINMFRNLIKPDQLVIDIGGHIGYFSLFFASLVGPKGKVFVFEPGENNLAYTRQNLANSPNIELVEKAVSDKNGILTFFIEGLTGQNNSLLEDYEGFKANTSEAHIASKYEKVEVTSVTLDTFISEKKVSPNFIKIDVEGAELLVLKGMDSCLKNVKPILMVELTNEKNEVLELLQGYGYLIFDPTGHLFRVEEQADQNTFCLHKDAHKALISQFFVNV